MPPAQTRDAQHLRECARMHPLGHTRTRHLRYEALLSCYICPDPTGLRSKRRERHIIRQHARGRGAPPNGYSILPGVHSWARATFKHFRASWSRVAGCGGGSGLRGWFTRVRRCSWAPQRRQACCAVCSVTRLPTHLLLVLSQGTFSFV